MGVFDGTVKIGRTVADPGTDHSLPPCGALSFGGIKAVTALSGTNGADACLITGNKWQQLNGKHTENVTMDHLLTIVGNRQEMVSGNHTHTIVGHTNATHVGVHNQTNVAPRNDTFVHTRTENHSEQEHQNQPTGRNEVTASEHTSTHEESHTKLEEHTATGFKFEAVGMNFETQVTNVESKMVNVGFHGISAEAKLMHHKSELFEERLQAFATDVVAVKLRAAVTHAKAIAADLNAGIAANLDSPFA